MATTVPRSFVPLTLFASILASSAAIASPADVAREWGLLGRWAVDCEHTVKQGGPHNLISYETTRQGKMFYRRNDQADDINEITDAKLGPNGIIVLTIDVPAYKQTREMGIEMTADGGTRSVYNHDNQGKYSVKDGIFTANGNQTPSLHRCR